MTYHKSNDRVSYAVRVPVISNSRKQGGTAIYLVPFQGRFFYILGKCSFLIYKNATRGCVLRRIRKMSQATAAGARMCQGTFFFLPQEILFPVIVANE